MSSAAALPRLCTTIVLAALLLVATAAPSQAAPSFRVRTILSNINGPVWVGGAPGDGRLFIIERRGRVLSWNGSQLRVFLDIRSRVNSTAGEQGLLSMAFHPDFATNGRYYVYYTNRYGDGRIWRFASTGATTSLTTGARIMSIPLGPFANHNGGTLAFGPTDGLLYISIGDGGGGGDPYNNAQRRTVLTGKLLRIDVDGASPYAIPATNPYAGSATYRQEIYANGLRNPWRMGFDRTDGDLYIADVGQSAREEINLLPASLPAGANFGWRRFEGTRLYSSSTSLATGTTHRPPIVQYSHGAGACSVTGGHVYRGTRIPSLQGYYLYADFCGRWIAGFTGAGGNAFKYRVGVPGIVSFGSMSGGEVFFASLATGGVYKIVP